MTDDASSTALERRLRGELAACIALDLANPYQTEEMEGGERRKLPRDPDGGRKGTRLETWFESTIERACGALWELGVADPIHEDGSPFKGKVFPPLFELTLDVEAIADCVAENPASDHVDLMEVITSFVGLADFREQISTGRGPFTPLPEYRKAMSLLAVAGFAEGSDNDLLWTDKIAPAMRAIYAWTDGGQSTSVIREEGLAAEAEEAWQLMPEYIKDAFLAEPSIDTISLSVVVAQLWGNGKWRKPPAASYITLPHRAIELARLLVEKIEVERS